MHFRGMYLKYSQTNRKSATVKRRIFPLRSWRDPREPRVLSWKLVANSLFPIEVKTKWILPDDNIVEIFNA
jgi:hypothetical protein